MYGYGLDYLILAIVALYSIIIHECSHGLVSYWMGDPTPKRDGRLSLNPFKHIDWIGILFLIVFRVGWAKPVRIDSEYYKKPKLGIFLVSLAGPLSNFILAFINSFFLTLILINMNTTTALGEFLYMLTYLGMFINISLGIFNLIPIPPLDGSKMLGSFLKGDAYYQYMKYQRYGLFFIMGLIILLDVVEIISGVSILSIVIDFVGNGFVQLWAKILL